MSRHWQLPVRSKVAASRSCARLDQGSERMSVVEVALAISAREWPDRIHRFLADHGGARVRAQVLTPDDAVAEDYQVLIIDDISSFLTPRLVAEIQRKRRQVLGVFDPADSPDAKESLQDCGVDQVIAADATADEFVVALRAMAILGPEHDSFENESEEARPGRPQVWVVGAPPGGCGATEVSISLAAQFARYGSVALVDLDDVAPAVAQRLGLALIPNLRSAIDVITHRQGSLELDPAAIRTNRGPGRAIRRKRLDGGPRLTRSPRWWRNYAVYFASW